MTLYAPGVLSYCPTLRGHTKFPLERYFHIGEKIALQAIQHFHTRLGTRLSGLKYALRRGTDHTSHLSRFSDVRPDSLKAESSRVTAYL
jgi:hypothetical protein